MIKFIETKHQSSFIQKMGYLLVASLPLTNIKFFGHLYLFELIAAIIFLMILVLFAIGFVKIRLNHTDYIVLAFGFFSLISVAINIDSLYESMRYYRHMVLVPILVYFLIRSIFFEVYSTQKGSLVLILVTIFLVVSMIIYYFRTGLRPEEAFGIDSLITASMLAAFAIFFFYYHIEYFEGLLFKTFLGIILVIIFLGLIVSMTRSAIFGVFLIPIILRIILNKKILQKVFLFSFLLGVFSLIFISYFYYHPNKTNFSPRQQYRPIELEREIDRITNIDSYSDDAKRRLDEWGYILSIGMKKPFLGYGGTYYHFAKGGQSTAHNIFISSFLTSGFLGLALLLTLYSSACLNIFSVNIIEPRVNILRKFIFASMIMMLMIGITNDFAGERAILFFFVIALSTNLNEFSKR